MSNQIHNLVLWPQQEECDVAGCTRKSAWHRFVINKGTIEIYYCYEHCPGVFNDTSVKFDLEAWKRGITNGYNR